MAKLCGYKWNIKTLLGSVIVEMLVADDISPDTHVASTTGKYTFLVDRGVDGVMSIATPIFGLENKVTYIPLTRNTFNIR